MLSPHSSLNTVCLLSFLSAVAATDLHRRRIPNLLTLAGAATGLTINLVTTGPSGLLTGGAGLLVGLAVFLPFYLARGMGAGDVKAMSAIGAFVGAKGVLLAAAWILVAGAVAALVISAARWTFRPLVSDSTGQDADCRLRAADVGSSRFPYGLSIACGTVASLLWS
jgi:prepilin peptidase CpaA